MVLSIHKLTKIIHPSIKLLDSPHKEDPLGTLLLRAPAVGMQTLLSVGVLFWFFNRRYRPSHLMRKVSPQPRTPPHSHSHS